MCTHIHTQCALPCRIVGSVWEVRATLYMSSVLRGRGIIWEEGVVG